MMRLILSLALAWTVFSSGGALVCDFCDGVRFPCSDPIPVNCSPNDTMCITGSTSGTVDGLETQFKACATAPLCPSTGSHNLSFEISTFSQFINAECCDTDRCNNGSFHSPGIPAINDLRCCIDSSCSRKIQCRGASDRCFPENPTNTTTIFGCASADLCGIFGDLIAVDPFLSMNIGPDVTCCDTCFCNDASTSSISVTLGLIPLLLGLFQSM